ncbi:hypothetical protein ACWOAH_10555 [Vagococcus vulneris]|uniref:Uncharacterized protein n=1 Tax=Vagococcus vulneris TaxID=1977869 RepID=A0A429ZT74_9ENTE|nr:hypothetical protein [Vagococcus vulneris]RST96933.1 hypothetical protein CBF37_10595 [Vagococcus vulneris]
MRNFSKELTELIEGNRKEIQVSKEEFLNFRDIWSKLPEKDKIVGEAQHNGHIIYRFFSDN